MPAYEILGASVSSALPDAIRVASIRTPRAGAAAGEFTFEVAGLVIASDGHARSVEVLCNGMLVREMPVEVRTGLQRFYPDLPDKLVCGFRSLVGVLVLPTEFELELVAVLDNQSRIPIGSITGRRGHPHPSFEPQLRPLMVTSVGRTGTVWMMRMLASHPSIVVQQHGPMEAWPARYWAHLLSVLSGPPDPVRSLTPHDFDRDLLHAGPNPFYRFTAPPNEALQSWLGQIHVDRLASFCLQNVEDWYALAARDQGKEPVYFAEKNLPRNSIPVLGVADLYPETREVFLVRDFRDMACSWLSFRGDKLLAKGVDTGRHLRELMVPWVDHLVTNWRARKNQAHLVRYEDLVLRPVETLAGVFEYLGIDSCGETIEHVIDAGSDRERFSAHGTSRTLSETVGRWTREGDPSFREGLNSLFRTGLGEFGYVEPATGEEVLSAGAAPPPARPRPAP